MLINQVAKKYNISVRAIRYYEELGLLTLQRNDSNVRIFNEAQLERLDEILLFKLFNFNLTEIKTILSSPQSEILTEKLHAELTKLEADLGNLLHKQHLLRSLLKTFGSSDISKQNLQEFISEQIYFKDERMINMLPENEKIMLEIGSSLIPIADSEEPTSLLPSIKKLRTELKQDYNIDVDLIRVRDNISALEPFEYQISRDGKVVVKKTIDFDSDSLKVNHIITNLKSLLL